MTISKKEGLTAYDSFVARAMANMQMAGETGPDGSVVAEIVYRSVTDDSWKMRYPVNSRSILTARRLLPDSIFLRLIRKAVLR